MQESFFEELKRYVGFGADDEAGLRLLAPHAAPHFPAIIDEFYAVLMRHEGARSVFKGMDQVERLKGTLLEWLSLLLHGPWDTAYYEKRARIGRVHVRVGLPQQYMFGAMTLIRIRLARVANEMNAHDTERRLHIVAALHKVLDMELAIMLDAYREAFVHKVQELEREEKKLLEERLALSEARYTEIVEKAGALIVTADYEGRIILFNHHCEELTGIQRDHARGQRWVDVFVPPERREELRGRREELIAGKRVAPYEGPMVRPDGAVRRVRWHFTTLPGELLCAMGIDVTEEHDLSVRTRQAERLASLGTMAAGLAHEIRNPLNAAHLQLTLMQRRLARKPSADVEGAIEAANIVAGEMYRLAVLVEEFLQFARPQPLRRTEQDLRIAADAVVALVGPQAANDGVDLRLVAGDPVVAPVDGERLKQVVLNLVRNAVEAAGAGGKVEVRVGASDGSALLVVEDNGPGLPSGDVPIFEPFFTTKPGGTGLGLSIVHRIVSAHGGRVNVESRPGRTVFSVLLPLRES